MGLMAARLALSGKYYYFIMELTIFVVGMVNASADILTIFGGKLSSPVDFFMSILFNNFLIYCGKTLLKVNFE